MKEVKGLEDRLSGLEQLMHGARKIVDDQVEMAQVDMFTHSLIQLLSTHSDHFDTFIPLGSSLHRASNDELIFVVFSIIIFLLNKMQMS